MENQEIQQVTTEMLVTEKVKRDLENEKFKPYGTKIFINTVILWFIAVLICIIIYYCFSETFFLLLSPIFFGVVLFGLALIYINKVSKKTQFKPNEKEIQNAIKKEYKKIAKEKLEKALELKEEIKKLKSKHQEYFSSAEEYIALGTKQENIDVIRWCEENQIPAGRLSFVQAYDKKIADLWNKAIT